MESLPVKWPSKEQELGIVQMLAKYPDQFKLGAALRVDRIYEVSHWMLWKYIFLLGSIELEIASGKKHFHEWLNNQRE